MHVYFLMAIKKTSELLTTGLCGGVLKHQDCHFKPGQSVPRSNVKQLVVNSLLASQPKNHDANNITVVKIYCVSTHQRQIPPLIRVNQLSPNSKNIISK